uniref:Uncharacterized protein n=1 Tax=Rhizophagus irregularis (strain DAOM 181602 / DAOM 197198 / MUCL 43194) TaxID=747089 RepID=U9TXH4_RHIID
MKANYFAEQFSIEDFHNSEEKDHLTLQQLFIPYNSKNIWNDHKKKNLEL